MATEARETVDLIGSDKVEGTAVYDAKGEKIGSIERVMIDKKSGQVAYAVLSFGGFLGIGAVRVSEGEERMLATLRDILGMPAA